MINYFLPAHRYFKIFLLEKLCIQPVKLSTFSTINQLPISKIKRYLNELQVEMENEDVYFPLIFIDSDTCILKKKENFSRSLTMDAVERIKYQTLKNYSPAFNICELMCKGERLNLSKIQSLLLLSKSQVYKIINELLSILKTRKIEIRFNNNGILDFIGDELDIRIFIYNFISDCFPKNSWFFSNTPKHQVHMDLKKFHLFSNISTYTLDKLCTFFGIVQSRLLLKRFLSPIKKEFHSSFLRFSYLPFEELQIFFINKRVFDEDIQYIEYLYLNFFLRIFIPDSISEENIREIGKHIEHSSNPDHKFLTNLLIKWENVFEISLPDKKRPFLLYNSALLSVLSFFIPNNISLFLDNSNANIQIDVINRNLFEKVANFISNFISEYDFPLRKKIYLKKKGIFPYTSLYYLETLMFLHPKLNIFLYFTTDFTSEKLLKNRIEQFYNSNVIKFVSNIEEANIIITDSYEDYPASIKTIPILNFLTINEISNIMNSIHEELINQLIM